MYCAWVFFEDAIFFMLGHGVVEGDLVVACDDYLVFELQFFEAFEEVLKMLFLSIPGEIPSMDENIPLDLVANQLVHLVGRRVSIRHCYDLDCFLHVGPRELKPLCQRIKSIRISALVKSPHHLAALHYQLVASHLSLHPTLVL